MKKLWDFKKGFSKLELEGQGRGIIMGVTCLPWEGHFTPCRPKRTKHFDGECILICCIESIFGPTRKIWDLGSGIENLKFVKKYVEVLLHDSLKQQFLTQCNVRVTVYSLGQCFLSAILNLFFGLAVWAEQHALYSARTGRNVTSYS